MVFIPPVNTVSHGSQMVFIPPVNTVSHGSQMVFIPPVNTVSHGSQTESLWERMQSLEVSVEPSTPPVNTVPHDMVVRWKACGKGGRAYSSVWNPLLHQSTQYHMTWWSDGKLVGKEAGLTAQCGTLYSTSQHSTT